MKRLKKFLADYNIKLVLCFGTRILETVPMQSITEAGHSRPRHQPAQARVAEAVVPRQKSAFGRQADQNQQ